MMSVAFEELEKQVIESCNYRINSLKGLLDGFSDLSKIILHEPNEYTYEDLVEEGVEESVARQFRISDLSEDERMLFRIRRQFDIFSHDFINWIVRWEVFPINVIEKMLDYLKVTKQSIQLKPGINELINGQSESFKGNINQLFQLSSAETLQSKIEIQKIMNSARFELFSPYIFAVDALLEKSKELLGGLEIRPSYRSICTRLLVSINQMLSTHLIYEAPKTDTKMFDERLRLIYTQAQAGDILHITFGLAFKLPERQIFPFDMLDKSIVLKDGTETIVQSVRCWSVHIDPQFCQKELPEVITESGLRLKPVKKAEFTYSYGENIEAFTVPLCFDFLNRGLSPIWNKLTENMSLASYVDVSPDCLMPFLEKGITVCLGLHVFDREEAERAFFHRYEFLCEKYPLQCIVLLGSCNLPLQVSSFSKTLIKAKKGEIKDTAENMNDFGHSIEKHLKNGIQGLVGVASRELLMRSSGEHETGALLSQQLFAAQALQTEAKASLLLLPSKKKKSKSDLNNNANLLTCTQKDWARRHGLLTPHSATTSKRMPKIRKR